MTTSPTPATASGDARLLTLQAVTFLHPGTGQTTGVVDLPIQREVHTTFPMIAGTGLKGSLRDAAERHPGWDDNTRTAVFGSKKDADTAGSLALTDARILAFPVRSLQRVFVWITCPMVIERLARDLRLAGITLPNLPAPATLAPGADQAWVPPATFTSPLVLEDIAFQVEDKPALTQLGQALAALAPADAGFDPDRLVLLADEEFTYLVKHATQVSARIALNERKTTTGEGGNLWYEETLPPETLLYALLLPSKPRDDGKSGLTSAAAVIGKVDDLTDSKFLQLGGNETVGQGWCQMRLTPATTAAPDPLGTSNPQQEGGKQ